MGTERLQKKAGTTKEELGRRYQTRPPRHGFDLERSRDTSKWQSRMASTCGPMHSCGCGM